MGANAQTSVPTFTAGEVLTAANMNISARTGVPVFANSTARDAAFGGTGEKVLAEGQLAYLEDSNIVQYYDGASWSTLGPTTSKIGQVLQTVKTDSFTTSSTTLVDVTGVSQAITPSSASSKVLVQVNGVIGQATAGRAALVQLVRNSTAIGSGTGGAAENTTTGHYLTGGTGQMIAFTINYLDSPATTSATTYKIQTKMTAATGTICIGRGTDNNDWNVITSITCWEILP